MNFSKEILIIFQLICNLIILDKILWIPIILDFYKIGINNKTLLILTQCLIKTQIRLEMEGFHKILTTIFKIQIKICKLIHKQIVFNRIVITCLVIKIINQVNKDFLILTTIPKIWNKLFLQINLTNKTLLNRINNKDFFKTKIKPSFNNNSQHNKVCLIINKIKVNNSKINNRHFLIIIKEIHYSLIIKILNKIHHFLTSLNNNPYSLTINNNNKIRINNKCLIINNRFNILQ